MKQREDFYKISIDTITSYFKKVHQENNVKVGFAPKKKGNFFVYPHINAIISSQPGSQVKEFLYTEYEVSDNWVKRKLIKNYVRILLNDRGFFAEKCLNIIPFKEDPASILIYPCNKKFRFFYFQKDYVDIFTKVGFDTENIQKEIQFRNKYKNYSFVHPVVEFGEEWYREKIIEGIPYARCSKEKKEEYINQIYKGVIELHKVSLNYSSLDNYIEKILFKIKKGFENLNNKGKKIDNKNAFINLLLHIEKTMKNKDFDIPLVMSHGDFQEGNIWLTDNRQVIFIDWETWAIRSSWYDLLVFEKNLRRKHTFFKNLNEYIKCNVHHTFSTLDDVTINRDDKNARKIIAQVVLLEDILWEINETNNLPKDIIGHGLYFYLNPKNLEVMRSLYE